MVVATFRGRFEDFDATLDGRRGRHAAPRRHRRRRLDRRQGREPRRRTCSRPTSSTPSATRSSASTSDDRSAVDGDELVVDGELTIKGHTRPVEARGTIVGPREYTFGDSRRSASTLEAIIDRTEFGLNWNAPLPKGGFALANDVKLIVELELAEQA